MKQNTTVPSVIEKFRRQHQRLKKFLVGFIIAIAVMVIVPLVLRSFPILRDNPGWKTWGTAWICLFSVIITGLGIAASFEQRCPSCAKPLRELFSTVCYCPYCGTKLRED